VGLVVISDFKGFHDIQILLLIQIQLLSAVVLMDELDECDCEGLFSPQIEVLLHFLIWMGVGIELGKVLFQAFDDVLRAA